MNLAVEGDPYEFRVGHSAAAVADTAAFKLAGRIEVTENGRTYFAESRVADDA